MCFLFLLLSLICQPPRLTITSPDFPDGGYMPARFTCEGEDVNPTLLIAGIPRGAKSLVLIVEDPDVALTRFTQWLVWNIPPAIRIGEDTVPGVQGTNTVGKNRYRGPCPGPGRQRYVFRIFALDKLLDLEENAKRYDVERAMDGHVLAAGQLSAAYEREAIVKENK